MGMCLTLVAVADSDIDRILADPPLAWRLFAPDDPGIYLESRKRKKTNFFSRLFSPNSEQPLPEEIGIGLTTDLDKAWHGIHYLLTATAWEGEFPHNFLLQGGLSSGDEEIGPGPARFFKSHVVAKIQQSLNSITVEMLQSRFNPKEMMRLDIYPQIWDHDLGEDDTLGYCIDYFLGLRNFLRAVCEEQLGIGISFG